MVCLGGVGWGGQVGWNKEGQQREARLQVVV